MSAPALKKIAIEHTRHKNFREIREVTKAADSDVSGQGFRYQSGHPFRTASGHLFRYDFGQADEGCQQVW